MQIDSEATGQANAVRTHTQTLHAHTLTQTQPMQIEPTPQNNPPQRAPLVTQNPQAAEPYTQHPCQMRLPTNISGIRTANAQHTLAEGNDTMGGNGNGASKINTQCAHTQGQATAETVGAPAATSPNTHTHTLPQSHLPPPNTNTLHLLQSL